MSLSEQSNSQQVCLGLGWMKLKGPHLHTSSKRGLVLTVSIWWWEGMSIEKYYSCPPITHLAVSNWASHSQISCKISFTVHSGLAATHKHIHAQGATSSGSQSCQQKPPPVGGWNCINKYLGITIYGGGTWRIYTSLLSAAQWWAFIRISTILQTWQWG